jgi:hypothetical protein
MGKRKRKVRLYLQDGPTIDGILAGRTRSEYIVWAPKVVTSEKTDAVEVTGHVEIPRERVVWYQVLPG